MFDKWFHFRRGLHLRRRVLRRRQRCKRAAREHPRKEVGKGDQHTVEVHYRRRLKQKVIGEAKGDNRLDPRASSIEGQFQQPQQQRGAADREHLVNTSSNMPLLVNIIPYTFHVYLALTCFYMAPVSFDSLFMHSRNEVRHIFYIGLLDISMEMSERIVSTRSLRDSAHFQD